jgi:hypothetical protein
VHESAGFVRLLVAAASVGRLVSVFYFASKARVRAVRIVLLGLGLVMLAMILWNTFVVLV